MRKYKRLRVEGHYEESEQKSCGEITSRKSSHIGKLVSYQKITQYRKDWRRRMSAQKQSREGRRFYWRRKKVKFTTNIEQVRKNQNQAAIQNENLLQTTSPHYKSKQMFHRRISTNYHSKAPPLTLIFK